jgi:hypothetical protein
MFTGALLLLALLIFDAQKNESCIQVADNPNIELTRLFAEVCPKQASVSYGPSSKHNSEVIPESISGALKHLEHLSLAKHQVCIKTQKQIHLELKPLINKQSGQSLRHRSRYDGPPYS